MNPNYQHEHKYYMVTSTPHIRAKATTTSVMRDVLIALAPAAVMAVVYMGLPALWVMLTAVASCVGFEAGYQKLMKQKVTVYDLSAAVTGLLLAFNLPASAPLWMVIVGSFTAIVLVKQLFGGLGQNFMNPALTARAVLLAAYPAQMTNWSIAPIDAITSPTPLAALKEGVLTPQTADVLNALIGRVGGCLGETCALALLAGGLYLLIRRIISWRIPVIYIGVVFVLSWIFGRDGLFTGNPVYEVLLGGLMLGAFFMATDYTTTPITRIGQVYMALGCGLITVMIRRFGSYTEGVSYSILLMNLAVPLIDRVTHPRIYGQLPKEKKAKGVRENA